MVLTYYLLKECQINIIKGALPIAFRSKVETVTAPDLAAKGAFDEVIRVPTGIIHVASPTRVAVSLRCIGCRLVSI